jgi:uncharacterized peroxidase-related enzyme
MPWIDTIHETDAEGALREVYDRITGARGKASNIMRVQSLHPEAMRAHLDLYLAVLFGRSGLRRAERELIAVVVSAANGCAYCVRHHAEALKALWKDDARVAQVAEDYRSLDSGSGPGQALSERERALCDYADALTRDPAGVEESAVERLRAVGLSDRDVLDANLIASYFNFVNRIAEGLGVAFTEAEATGYRY